MFSRSSAIIRTGPYLKNGNEDYRVTLSSHQLANLGVSTKVQWRQFNGTMEIAITNQFAIKNDKNSRRLLSPCQSKVRRRLASHRQYLSMSTSSQPPFLTPLNYFHFRPTPKPGLFRSMSCSQQWSWKHVALAK